MFRRLESLFAALGLFAAFGGGYYLHAITGISLVNTWNLLALAAGALSFLGVSIAVHKHRSHTRIFIVLGFLISLAVALYVRSNYPTAQYAFLPEAALLLLTLICSESRVVTKEPDSRKPEHVGAAREQHARRRR